MSGGRWCLLAAAALLLTACAAGPNVASAVDGVQLAGFWQGIWHGLIYPVTFFISLFNDNVTIYEVRNNGNWYDFGFVAGIGLLHAVVDTGRRAPRRRRARAPKSASGPVT
ncbi:hypothetical protein SAMN04488564_10261 [Lentzea waywayandensis]|uniref:Integral membrane protein n=1 Tax=Lentzea waywayandensis TaxID=84724 RepID=A0A1I6D9Q9_9PSEU|nr:hypothetical protein [Lentzea waywayandensis]SFR02179.1 hypothetical protein SAMN04488564_10261 [Lentzea waywayandensis]